MGQLAYYDADGVSALLDYPGCIVAVRAAMAELSERGIAQPLRSITELGPGRLFAQMPGLRGPHGDFGAKLLSVFEDEGRPGRSEHRGLVALFDPINGEPVCVADASAITLIRTAAASAVATDALARPDARCVALFGCGAQATTHLRALVEVRPIDTVLVWGRDVDRVGNFCRRMGDELGVALHAVHDGREAAAEADIICTLTSSPTPILSGHWVQPGTHVNAVGSNYAGPVEIDHALLLASRYIVDSRRSALAAAAEYLAAEAEGLIDESHIAGEIGDVLLGRVAGRRSASEITLYKSLGHIVQDLAATAYVHARNVGGSA